MKSFNPAIKLFKGIVLFASFHILYNYLGGADGLRVMEKSLNLWMLTWMPVGLADLLAPLLCLPIPIYMVYAAVSGLYRIVTFNHYLETFEN